MADTEFVRGAERLRARIASIRENTGVPALVEEVSTLLLRRTLDRFNQEVDPDGRPWAALAPATLLIKRRLGFGHKGKLKRTDELYRSIRVIRGGRGTVYTNTGAGVRIGVDNPKAVEKARAQNSGTERIKARRFLGIGRLDIKAVDSLMRRKAKQLERL